MNKQYLSVGELASMLAIGEKWCYKALQKGLIPGAFKIGGRWFIDKCQLEQGLKDLQAKPTMSVRSADSYSDRHSLL